jgi:hypothetical protein
MRIVLLLLGTATLAAPLSAQQAKLERPNDWEVRFDRSGTPDSAIYFVSMPPGWHVTTGPAAILYSPASTAEGDFRVQSTIFLFDPGQRHREAYGILIGGKDLDGPNQSYTYFVIRDTGDFLVKRRDGSATETVRQWSPSSAIMKHPGGENAKNVLTIEAKGSAVDFFVNGEKVTSVPRSDLQVDGVVGLRVNHGLNLHVVDLVVEPLGGADGR